MKYPYHPMLAAAVMLGAGLVLFSEMNLAGTATVAQDKASAPAATMPVADYNIRCWQYGRLIFEEQRLSPVGEPFPYVAKLKRNDRQGAAVYLTDTGNATCLIRAGAAKVAAER
jgi:hypothetical protein